MNDEEIKQSIARAFERLLGEEASLDFHGAHERSSEEWANPMVSMAAESRAILKANSDRF